MYGPGGGGSDETEKQTTSTETEKIEVVFVVEDGIAKMRPVATGLTSETDIEILSGLEEGEKIVIGSYRILSKELKNNDLVKESSTPSESEK